MRVGNNIIGSDTAKTRKKFVNQKMTMRSKNPKLKNFAEFSLLTKKVHQSNMKKFTMMSHL